MHAHSTGGLLSAKALTLCAEMDVDGEDDLFVHIDRASRYIVRGPADQIIFDRVEKWKVVELRKFLGERRVKTEGNHRQLLSW